MSKVSGNVLYGAAVVWKSRSWGVAFCHDRRNTGNFGR
jgi:hypothetical protein